MEGVASADGLTGALNGIPEVWVQALGLAAGAILAALILRAALREWLIPLTERTRFEIDGPLLQAIAGPLAWTLGFLGVIGAARLLVPADAYDANFRRTLITGLLLIWGSAGGHVLVVLIRRGSRRVPGRERSTGVLLLQRSAKVAVGVVVILSILAVWRVNVTPLVASAGLIGIALALAAQDTLANLFAGLAVYLDHPYDVGDWIVLDQGTEEELDGQVVDVGLRSTRILTRDGVLVTVPNSVIANARVVNESGHVPRYRVRLPVGVAYASDLDRVERVLLEVAHAHPDVLDPPPPLARVRGFGESSIDVELLVWVRDPQAKPRVVHELAKRVHHAFREAGITIPFPQRDVHLAPPPAGDQDA